jgi:hypothetical protein
VDLTNVGKSARMGLQRSPVARMSALSCISVVLRPGAEGQNLAYEQIFQRTRFCVPSLLA